jgi:hypothetical protein
VTLTPSVVDANNMPVMGWAVALNATSVNVPLNGSTTAVATLTVPSVNNGLVGTVKFATTSSATLGTREVTSAVTALNQVSFSISSNGNSCVLPTGTTQVKVGTTVRLVNTGTIGMIFHSNGDSYGLPHQNTGGPLTAPTNAYENTITSADGGSFDWYCHTPDTNNQNQNPQILAVP